MAKGDLFKIIQEIQAELKSTEKRAEVDSYTHILEISAKDIAKQINIQIAEYRSPGRQQGKFALSQRFGITTGRTFDEAIAALNEITPDEKISITLAELYAKQALTNLLKTGSSNYQVRKLSGSDTEYKIEVSYIGQSGGTAVKKYGKVQNSTSVFDFIRDEGLLPARNMVRQRLKTHLGTKASVSNVEKVFNLGHITAVSSFKIATAVSKVNELTKTAAYTEVVKELINFEVFSQFTELGDPELTKAFEGKVAYVRPESATFNNLQSAYETALLNRVKDAFKKVIESNDWANQGGSDTLIDAIAKDLMGTAARRGAKVSLAGKKQTKARTVAKATSIVERKTKVTRGAGNIGGQVTPTEPQQSAVSLQSLLPFLNQNLPEIIKSRMGQAGRLVNRTGRFAESARVVSIDGDVVSYTYMRNPYEVFEGNSARDPRPLIEGSIRELAVGLIQQRFSVRRA